MNELTTILYVDDEPINLLLFKTMFRSTYSIITADSGIQGLEILSANPDISIAISDMSMPQMNGLEFISIAKEKYPNIIFCILTGFSITEEIISALDKKLIYKYFIKPFRMMEIQDAITKALKS